MTALEGGRRRVPRSFAIAVLWLAAVGVLAILLALVFLAVVLV